MLRYLSEDDVRRALTMDLAIGASEAAFAGLASGAASAPARMVFPVPCGGEGSFSLAKPAVVEPDARRPRGVLGTKLVAVRPANAGLGLPTVPSVIVLQDATTAVTTAVMGATHLTAVRTAAGSAVATRLLAPADARVLVVFGAGLQGHQHAVAVCAVRPSVRRVVVVNRGAERAAALAETLRGELPGGVEVETLALADEDAVRRAVGEAQIVCTGTNSREPVVRGEWLVAPCHLNLVGSFRPHMREADAAAVDGAALVVADSEDALATCGELAGLDRSRVRMVGDLVAEAAGGRAVAAPGGVTIFKSVGTAVQDAATAAAVLERAAELGIGTLLPA